MNKRIGFVFAIILTLCLSAALLIACKPNDPIVEPPIDNTDGKYMLKYIHKGGSGDIPEIEYYNEGDTVTVKSGEIFTRKGFEFICWLDGDTQFQPGDTFEMPARHVQLEAYWDSLVAGNVTLRYDTNGGEGSVPETTRVAKGSNILLPSVTLTREGYTFLGWSDGKNDLNAGASYTVPARNVTIRARWKRTVQTIDSNWVWAKSSSFDTNPDTAPIQVNAAIKRVRTDMYCLVTMTDTGTNVTNIKAVRLTNVINANRSYESAAQDVKVEFSNETLQLTLIDVDGVSKLYTFTESEPNQTSTAKGTYSRNFGRDNGAKLVLNDDIFACEVTIGHEAPATIAAIEINAYFIMFPSENGAIVDMDAILYAWDNKDNSTLTMINLLDNNTKYVLTKE